MRRVLSALSTAVVLLVLAAPAATAESFTFTGSGNGHGVGMSQYGARGGAQAGENYRQILATYYQGTTVGARSTSIQPRINVVRDATTVRLWARGASAVVTGGANNGNLPAGSSAIIRLNADGSCKVDSVSDIRQTAGACPRFDPRSGGRIEVQVPRSGGGWTTYREYNRGFVDVVSDRLGPTTYRIDVVVQLPNLNQYLYGLAEVPYSWETAALQAQAVAGRSFALHRLLSIGTQTPDRGCSCHLFDSQQDQVYAGYDQEKRNQWNRWKAAVDGTGQEVVLADAGAPGTQGGVVQAFYSSSSNGITESKHESQSFSSSVWPYMVSVDDPWTFRNGNGNPYRSWTAEVPTRTVERAVGLEPVLSIDVIQRSSSGAATQVRFTGIRNGATVERFRSGASVRTTFGLRSTTISSIFLPPFVDDEGSIHQADINWIAAQNITRGCNPPANNRFCPRDAVTRGEMAAFLVRAFDLPASTRDVFRDDNNSIFEADIQALAAAGVTKGCNPPDNDRFCPDEPVTRGEMAAFLVRVDGLPASNQDYFVDDNGSIFEAEIQALRRAGITKGCNPPDNDRFCPRDSVTREQMASFLRRAVTR